MSDVAKLLKTLAPYKGVTVKARPVTVTEEEIASELQRARGYASRTEEKAEGAVAEMGDQAVIDFIGYINGEAFEGGDGTDYPLVLGSNTFIPGFEAQLVGAGVGAQVDVKVPFPENYHAAEYAGKDAIFKVTIKSLRRTVVPELSDDVVSKISPCKTVEEFKEYVKKEITRFKTDQALQAKEDEVLTKIVEASEIEVEEAMIEERAAALKNNLLVQLQNSGNTLEAYCDYNNMSEGMLDIYLKRDAENMLKGQAVLLAIAKEENFSYTEAELEEELFKLARGYQTTVGELKEMIGADGIAMVGDDILHKQALAFITENAVEE